MKEEDKMRFMKVYQNLPLNERRNVIVVLEIEKDKGKIQKEPLSWDIAFLEIEQETKIGETILNKLIRLNLI